jgi:hypothetical protein
MLDAKFWISDFDIGCWALSVERFLSHVLLPWTRLRFGKLTSVLRLLALQRF